MASRRKISNSVIYSLVIFFFSAAVVFIFINRSLMVNPVWVLLLVSFSLSITGALILFYILDSSAVVTRESYKLGGAIAGFVVLFSLFYNLASQSIIEDSETSRIAQSPLRGELVSVADSYQRIGELNRESTKKFAESTLLKFKATFKKLSRGAYDIDADELETYLFPIIDKAGKVYLTSQDISQEAIWPQYWDKKYFESMKVLRDRKITMRQILIFDDPDSPDKLRLLSDLVNKHVDQGIDVRLVNKSKYVAAYGANSKDDFHNILLLDGQVSGLLTPRRRGSFKVELSIDKETYVKRERNFNRLLTQSQSYKEWSGE